ncbi:hypothetical protein K1X76_06625 [bacterium]|nr:hypothetical protein [bacterium]
MNKSWRFVVLFLACTIAVACADGKNSGKDPNAGLDPMVDHDGDGFTIDSGDCDDTNDQIWGPGEPDICTDDLDNNCDGIILKCKEPTVVFRDHTDFAGYFTRVTPHGVAWSSQNPNNNDKIEALFFDLNQSDVAANDALFKSIDSDLNAEIGVSNMMQLGNLTCVASGYHNNSSGQTCCYNAQVLADQAISGGTLDCSNADLVINGEDTNTFTAESLLLHDLNQDGNDDLVVSSSMGLPSVLFSSGLPFSGTLDFLSSADITLDPCQRGNLNGFCGYQMAANNHYLALTIGAHDESVQFFELPLLPRDINNPYQPSASISGSTDFAFRISAASRGSDDRFLISNPIGARIKYVDGETLTETGSLQTDVPQYLPGSLNTTGLSQGMATMTDMNGDTLLIVGAPYIDPSLDNSLNTYTSVPSGIFVFNITQNGFPSSTREASYFLASSDMNVLEVNGELLGPACGFSVSGGIVRDGDICHTVVSSGCMALTTSGTIGYGGAAYVLESMPCGQMPPPPPNVNDLVHETDNNNYTVDNDLPRYYIKNPGQFNKLAHVLKYRLSDGTLGYKIDRIRPELEALGLSNNDVITHANGIPLKEMKNVLKAFQELKTSHSINLTVNRAQKIVSLQYRVVQ